MNLSYRAALIEDAPLLEQIFRLSFSDAFGHLYAPEDLDAFLREANVPAWARELADPAMKVRLAMVGELAAGFARVGPGSLPKQYPERSIELRQLYLLPEFTGRGIGSSLLAWAIGEARSSGAAWLYLSAYIDNHGARRLYRAAGFVDEGPYSFMVGNHADEDVVMRMAL